MNEYKRKIALRVFGAHVAVILLMVVVPLFKGCFKPKPKDMIMMVEFGGPAEPVTIEPVSQMANPEPVAPTPAPEPEPVPAPVPEPVKIPEPIKKTEPVKKLEPVKKTEPVKAPEPVKKTEPTKQPEPDKWKPVDPKDIKIGKSVNNSPRPPSITSADIQKALSGIASASSGSTVNPSAFNDYLAQVMRMFYREWDPPAAASSATGSAIVRITMRSNGQITKRTKIKGSGDALYDRTVMDAANKVGTLPKPPANYPFDYVEVIFTLDN